MNKPGLLCQAQPDAGVQATTHSTLEMCNICSPFFFSNSCLFTATVIAQPLTKYGGDLRAGMQNHVSPGSVRRIYVRVCLLTEP